MKTTSAILCLVWVLTGAMAAQALPERVAVEFKSLSVSYHSDPAKSDSKRLPMIEGVVKSRSRESFGVFLGGVPAGEKILEILGPDGTVLRSVSIGEFLGKGTTAFRRIRVQADSRRVETVYAVELPGQTLTLVLKSLATGDGPGADSDQHLVVTFALRSEKPMRLALRVSLPVVGTIAGENNDCIITRKSGGPTLAAAVYPATAVVAVRKNRIVMTSPQLSLDGSEESQALWFVMDETTSTPGAHAETLRALRGKRFGKEDPHVVVVSMTDRNRTQPGDTVTYTLICANIGTAAATDVALKNPVPAGMDYVVGSATPAGSELSFQRAPLAGPSPGAVAEIRWTFSSPIPPGGERVARFKVRVR